MRSDPTGGKLGQQHLQQTAPSKRLTSRRRAAEVSHEEAGRSSSGGPAGGSLTAGYYRGGIEAVGGASAGAAAAGGQGVQYAPGQQTPPGRAAAEAQLGSLSLEVSCQAVA
jgi:hypothetical protein